MTHEKMTEALRLAQAARSYVHVAPESGINPLVDHMASALERQHAEIERLREALTVARMSTGFHMMHPATQAIIDAALQSTKGQP